MDVRKPSTQWVAPSPSMNWEKQAGLLLAKTSKSLAIYGIPTGSIQPIGLEKRGTRIYKNKFPIQAFTPKEVASHAAPRPHPMQRG